MARSDDDTWDINESVGATALGVAGGRAAETNSADPLINDPYAQLFLDATDDAMARSPTGATNRAPANLLAPIGSASVRRLTGIATGMESTVRESFSW